MPPQDGVQLGQVSGCPFLKAKARQTAPQEPSAGDLNATGLAGAAQAGPAGGTHLSTVAVSQLLGLEFQRYGRGLDFWKKQWLTTSSHRAIELALQNKPVRVMMPDQSWLPVGDLDELNATVTKLADQARKQALQKQAETASWQAASSLSGCPFAALLQQPPAGPKEVGTVEFLRRALAHRENPAHFISEFHAKHGDSFTLDVPTKGRFVFDRRIPVLHQALHDTDGGEMTFGKARVQGHGAEFLIGEKNMFLSGGKDWKSIQEVLRPYLGGGIVHGEPMMQKLTDIFSSHLGELREQVAASPNGELVVDAREVMQRAVLDVALQVFLGEKLPPSELREVQHAFTTQIEWLTRESINPTDVSLSRLPGGGELKQAYQVLNGLADRIVANRKSGKTRGDDMLTGLLKARDPETGEPLSDERLRHEVLSLLEAGHETTATLMAWNTVLLSRHPEEYEKLQAEVDQATAGGRVLTGKEVQGLKQASNITQEALRLYPPFYLFMREAQQDVEIQTEAGPMPVKAGTTVVTSLYDVNRNEAVWGSEKTGFPAHEFHPDRFEEKTPRLYAFGGGKRVCLGQALGRLESNLMLSMLAKDFDLQALHDGPLRTAADLSIHPEDAQVKLRLRQPER